MGMAITAAVDTVEVTTNTEPAISRRRRSGIESQQDSLDRSWARRHAGNVGGRCGGAGANAMTVQQVPLSMTGLRKVADGQVSPDPIALIRSNTRLRTTGSMMR
jgi:hypothetical protein